MSRDLSTVEKKLLLAKVPKALGQGRKSFETKTEANAVLHKAGYKKYFDIDPPIVHTDKKAKIKYAGSGAGVDVGTSSKATIVAKAASKSKKDAKKLYVPSINYSKVCYVMLSCVTGITSTCVASTCVTSTCVTSTCIICVTSTCVVCVVCVTSTGITGCATS